MTRSAAELLLLPPRTPMARAPPLEAGPPDTSWTSGKARHVLPRTSSSQNRCSFTMEEPSSNILDLLLFRDPNLWAGWTVSKR